MLERSSNGQVRLYYHCACGQRLNAPARARGLPARCPGCGRINRVPFDVPSAPHIGSIILAALREPQE